MQINPMTKTAEKKLRSPLFAYDIYIFDFDGVIADSLHIKTDAFVELYKDYSPEIQQKVRQYHIDHGGVSRFEKFVLYEREFLGNDPSQDYLDELAIRFGDIVREKVIAAPYIPGALKFLDELKHIDATMFVASATPKEELDIIIEEKGLSKFFKQIYGAPFKKSDVVKRFVDEGVSLDKIIFFGDALADYDAALQYGVDFLGIGNPDDNIFPDGTFVIENFEHIEGL